MSSSFRWGCALVGLVLWALPCAAQLTLLGGDLQTKGTGTTSLGYSTSSSNQGASNHSLNFGGSGNFTGFYYNPSFVSFTLLPYYNQSRDNSTSQSLTNSSGVDFTSNILKETHFPGSISFNKGYNSTGTSGIANLPGFTSHGSGQGFGIGWSALLPGFPTLTATFAAGGGTSSVYGTSSQSTGQTRNFGLRSSYSILGLQSNASYNHSTSDTKTPEFLSSQKILDSTSTSNVYSLSTSHSLPLSGSISSSISRSDYTGTYFGGGNTDTTDYQTANLSLRPLRRIILSFGEGYSDNLAGTLNQAIISAGGVPQSSAGLGSHSLNLSGSMSYSIMRNLSVVGQATHVDQVYAGQSYQGTYYSGTVNGGYGRRLFGLINWSASVVDNANQVGNSAVGLLTSADISRKLKGWNLSGSFSYAQNVQTLLVLYTNSYYRYGGQASRRFNHRMSWSGQVGMNRSTLSGGAASASSSENFSSTFSARWLTASGDYSKMSGTSIFTVNGPQVAPVPTPVLPLSQLILYGGNSYGFSLSGTPVRKLTFFTGYTKAVSDTVQNATNSANQTRVMNGSIQYQMRKLSLHGGYTRYTQSISASGSKPSDVSSYYFGIFRSFKFF